MPSSWCTSNMASRLSEVSVLLATNGWEFNESYTAGAVYRQTKVHGEGKGRDIPVFQRSCLSQCCDVGQ